MCGRMRCRQLVTNNELGLLFSIRKSTKDDSSRTETVQIVRLEQIGLEKHSFR